MIKTLKSLSLCAALCYSSVSAAVIYDFSEGPGSFGNGGTFDSISTSYSTNTSVLTWEVENAQKNGALMDGFWLVLNDGPNNPKGDDGLAIFYADFVDYDNAGSADNIGLWAYEYNGQNSPNSYSQTDFLGDLTPGLIDNGTTRGFSIDVSSIFSQIATPFPYDDEIGIWFHPTWNTFSTTNAINNITNWTYGSQSWYDRSGQATTPGLEPGPTVPEPSTLAVFALGLFGLSLVRAKRA